MSPSGKDVLLDRFLTLWIFLAMFTGFLQDISSGNCRFLEHFSVGYNQYPYRNRPDPDDVPAAGQSQI